MMISYNYYIYIISYIIIKHVVGIYFLVLHAIYNILIYYLRKKSTFVGGNNCEHTVRTKIPHFYAKINMGEIRTVKKLNAPTWGCITL